MRDLSWHSLAALIATGLLAMPLAYGEQLDWDAEVWDPPGNSNLSETFDDGKIVVTLPATADTCGAMPCTTFLSSGPGVESPGLNKNNTGGAATPENSLYIATDYTAPGSGMGPGDPTAPAVSVVLDFRGYAHGVGNVDFTIFDLDASVGFHDDLTVTAMTTSGAVINPTQLTSGADNQVVSANGISGVPGSGSPSNSADGNAGFSFSQNGIASITIVYRNIIAQPNPGFQSISISDINFLPSPPFLNPGLAAFDNTTIIGKVFNDLNADGWQDPNEKGVPGVRLITTEGLLIETDSHGRYHIAAVDGGLMDRGRNYIVKVDPATLPRGTIFTTENPRQKRITRGLLNRFNFGVQLPGDGLCCEEVELKLSELFFAPGSATLRSEYTQVLAQFSNRLRDHGSGVITIAGNIAPDARLPLTAAARESVGEYTLTPRFGVRKATLTDEDRDELNRIADEWRGVDDIRLEAIGHTSNVGIARQNRHEFADNYQLSKARAEAVAHYLRSHMGIAASSITTAGRGPDQPIASNATEAGRAANRRVELRITGRVANAERDFKDPATKLAEERSLQVYLAIKSLLGSEILRSVDFRFAEDPIPLPAGKQCGVDRCSAEPSYAFELSTRQLTDQPDDTRFARADKDRVDVRGMFTIAVPGGGVLSAIEDPVVVEPRLAVLGPKTLPIEDGRIGANSIFYVYTNYPSFITARLEVFVYRADDVDRLRPLARLPLPVPVTQNFSRVEWDGYTGRERLRDGEALQYFIQACDGPHIDETTPQTIQLVNERHHVPAVATRLTPTLKKFSGSTSLTPVLNDDTPLNGNVVVFRHTEATPREYTFRPRFETRKANLSDEARLGLDRIADEWQEARDVRISVIGHTDNVRIAPRNQGEFANNQVLSEARADTVARYIAGQLGLGLDRISVAGRGSAEPIATNLTAEGRATNRRVELQISGMPVTARNRTLTAITLVDPANGTEEPIVQSLTEAQNVLLAKREVAAASGETVNPRPRAKAMPTAQSSAEALELLYGRNDLQQQNIPIRGSRVRVRGRDIAASHSLQIDGQSIPLDANGKFAAEYLMPIGSHEFDVVFFNKAGAVVQRDILPIEVTGEHMFAVAMIDLSLATNDVSGAILPLPTDSRYKDDFLAEGRVAFYLKGRIKGKYLVTAQLDTQEEQLENLFGNLDREDPRAVFRHIDPDRYYPVYGDDSTTISDTDSQGRLYARIEWDRSEARWGNFHTDITGNEFAQYNRSLYGGQVHYKSIDTTGLGEPEVEGQIFASDTQTALGHVEFVGTAGSLYYLKHSNVLQGSEKTRVELRDRDSGRVIANQTLVRNVDYEIDELQGRVILSRPLPSITNLLAPGLIRQTPLDGNDVVLIIDYEYLPDSFNSSQLTTGARGKYWLTETLAVGGTWVDESRAGEDYSLFGGDVTWQLGRGTYLKGEYADSEATQTGRFRSADGGLSFSPLLNPGSGRSGDAYSIEGRVNTAELLGTEREWIGAAWMRRTDDNFSVARRDTGADTVEYGAELTGELSDKLSLAARFSATERESVVRNDITRIALQADYRLGEKDTLSGEIRTEEHDQGTTKADTTLAAVRYGHRFGTDIELYGIGQFTIDNDLGISSNDLLTVGINAQLLRNTQLQSEFSSGDRGESARLGFDYTLNSQRHIYGTYTHSTDRTDPFGGNQAVIGQRSQISNQTDIFTESQFSRRDDEAGLAHVIGLDFKPGSGWKLGATLQTGEVFSDIAVIDRDAASLSAAYHSPSLGVASRIEYRKDKGGANLTQWLSSNRLDYKFSDDLKVLARVNYSDTRNPLSKADGANFFEGTIGAALRPTDNDRLNILGKYTFLKDLRGPEQTFAGADQRSHIVTGDFLYRFNDLLDLGTKLGWRRSDLRSQRNAGEWVEATTLFGAFRTTYHLLSKWDGIAEFRILDVENAASVRSGILVELDRHFGKHLKLGLGYNFTEFSDDLTNPDFDARGFFFNATGKY